MKKVRIQFELPEHKIKDLDNLMEICGIETRRELFNYALSTLEWAALQKHYGYEVGAFSQNKREFRMLSMPALDNIQKAFRPRSSTDTEFEEPAIPASAGQDVTAHDSKDSVASNTQKMDPALA